MGGCCATCIGSLIAPGGIWRREKRSTPTFFHQGGGVRSMSHRWSDFGEIPLGFSVSLLQGDGATQRQVVGAPRPMSFFAYASQIHLEAMDRRRSIACS